LRKPEPLGASGGDQQPNPRHVADLERGGLAVEREEIDEGRHLVEQEVAGRRDTGCAAFFGKEFIEPVEERRSGRGPVAARSLRGGAELRSQLGGRHLDATAESLGKLVKVSHDVLTHHLGALVGGHCVELRAMITLRASAMPSGYREEPDYWRCVVGL
jgi:hypothetical protein